jgi:hypothetical protein
VTLWNHAESVYMCNVQNFDIFNQNRVKVDKASGEHFDGKNDKDVRGFAIFRAYNLHYFPEGIDKVFVNIFWIAIHKSNLNEISQSDLKVFPELKYLYLDENQLEVLNADLFKYNTKLELIWIYKNPFKHIDAKVFSSLGLLRTLRIGTCKSTVTLQDAYNAQDLAKVIERIEEGECEDRNRVTPFRLEKVIELSEKVAERDEIKTSSILWFLFLITVIAIVVYYVTTRRSITPKRSLLTNE